MEKIIHLVIICLFTTNILGCASKASKIEPAYVSPSQYSAYNCNQIDQKLQRVHREVLEVSGKQDGAAKKDAIALGVGVVLFWPALFFMIGGDKKKEVSRLKGEYEALQQAAIEKECDLPKEKEDIKKVEEEHEKNKVKLKEKPKDNEI
ncbi:MAG: hypothetical protein ABIJ59_16455 [Pseudomonadota bacterium]